MWRLSRLLLFGILLCVSAANVAAHANCFPRPIGLVNWWGAEGDSRDSVTGAPGKVSGNVKFVPGEVGTAFAFTGGDSISFEENIANFGTNAFTVEFWIRTTAPVSENYEMAVMEKRPQCNYYSALWCLRMGGPGTRGRLVAEISSDNVLDSQSMVATRPINDGAWHHVAFIRNGRTIKIYIDGMFNNQHMAKTIANITGSSQFVVGQSVCACCDGTLGFNGAIDELSIYRRELSMAEIKLIYFAGAAGKCGIPPRIISNPTSRTSYAEVPTMFDVDASGSGPLRFQWRRDSKPIHGATSSAFTTRALQANAGTYSVVVANSYGFKLSSKATLTVLDSTNCVSVNDLTGWWGGEQSGADFLNLNNGTTGGSLSFTNGVVGSAFRFDGTDSVFNVNTNVGNFGTNDFTIEFWVQTTSTANLQSCLEKRDVCSGGHFWDIRIGNCSGCDNHGPGHVVFEVYGCPSFQGCGNWLPVTAATAINDGFWHHVACVRKGATSLVYIDGHVDGSGVDPYGVAYVSNDAVLRAGQNRCQCCDGTQAFNGGLDEISIYNRALDALELEGIYAVGSLGKCGVAARGQ